MTVLRIKGLKRYRAKGQWYAYHRKTGIRLKAEFGTAEFIAKLALIERKLKTSNALPGTLGFPWLEMRWSRCKTPSDVDLAAMKHPPTTFVHDLAPAGCDAGNAPRRAAGPWQPCCSRLGSRAVFEHNPNQCRRCPLPLSVANKSGSVSLRPYDAISSVFALVVSRAIARRISSKAAFAH